MLHLLLLLLLLLMLLLFHFLAVRMLLLVLLTVLQHGSAQFLRQLVLLLLLIVGLPFSRDVTGSSVLGHTVDLQKRIMHAIIGILGVQGISLGIYFRG